MKRISTLALAGLLTLPLSSAWAQSYPQKYPQNYPQKGSYDTGAYDNGRYGYDVAARAIELRRELGLSDQQIDRLGYIQRSYAERYRNSGGTSGYGAYGRDDRTNRDDGDRDDRNDRGNQGRGHGRGRGHAYGHYKKGNRNDGYGQYGQYGQNNPQYQQTMIAERREVDSVLNGRQRAQLQQYIGR